MRVLPRWATEGGLGTSDQSKHFPEKEVADTERMYIYLRAWMLHRARFNSFHTSRPGRQTWYQNELRSLALDIQSLGVIGGGTGSVHIDEQVKVWVPEIQEYCDGF